ncbi:AMP-binding protein [Nocardioidaceae bacterium]|nr:AMP-binding protein [Nocardioidaceae bacterium]
MVRDQVADWLREARPQPLVVETSGSTGDPKRVVLTREAVLASVEATHERLGGPGAWLLTLPHAYVAGVQVLVRSLHAGHAPVLRGEGESLAEAVARLEGPRRYVSLVPTQLYRLLEAVEHDGPEALGHALQARRDLAALTGLDAVLLGGGPVDVDLRLRAARHGIETVATYGMAETAGGCVYDGVPLDGVEVVTDDDSRLRIAGPMLFGGYEGDPTATAAVLRGGWFRTADLGEVQPATADRTVRVRVLGRADDVVVTGGVNVPGPVVAARLAEHPMVEACEVIGVEDAEWGRRLVAYVVLDENHPEPTGEATADRPTATELRDWVALVHPRSWAPREVLVVPRIPRTDRGKVDRAALLARGDER